VIHNQLGISPCICSRCQRRMTAGPACGLKAETYARQDSCGSGAGCGPCSLTRRQNCSAGSLKTSSSYVSDTTCSR